MASTAITPGHIQVSGLDEFRAALRTAEVRTPEKLTRALREIGNDVKRGVRERMQPQLKLPLAKRTGRLKASPRVRTSGNEMEVRLGDGLPYAGWWEFGGREGGPNPPPPREFIRSGRTLYPTLKAQRPDIELRMALLLTELSIQLENQPPTRVGI